MPAPNAIADFWRQVTKTDSCWLYTGMPAEKRYPRFGWKGQKVKAHRFSWCLAHGEIPAGMQICHHCDVPRCVRPDHLFIGTHKQNMVDRDSKSRHVPSPGSRNGFAKLTEQDVLLIRRRYAEGVTQVALAAAHHVYQTTISKIVLRKAWRHI